MTSPNSFFTGCGDWAVGCAAFGGVRGWHGAAAATSTTWPLCGTSPDCYWCRFEKQGHHTSLSHPLSTSSLSRPMSTSFSPSGSSMRSTTCFPTYPLRKQRDPRMAKGSKDLEESTSRTMDSKSSASLLLKDSYARARGRLQTEEDFSCQHLTPFKPGTTCSLVHRKEGGIHQEQGDEGEIGAQKGCQRGCAWFVRESDVRCRCANQVQAHGS